VEVHDRGIFDIFFTPKFSHFEQSLQTTFCFFTKETFGLLFLQSETYRIVDDFSLKRALVFAIKAYEIGVDW